MDVLASVDIEGIPNGTELKLIFVVSEAFVLFGDLVSLGDFRR